MIQEQIVNSFISLMKRGTKPTKYLPAFPRKKNCRKERQEKKFDLEATKRRKLQNEGVNKVWGKKLSPPSDQQLLVDGAFFSVYCRKRELSALEAEKQCVMTSNAIVTHLMILIICLYNTLTNPNIIVKRCTYFYADQDESIQMVLIHYDIVIWLIYSGFPF